MAKLNKKAVDGRKDPDIKLAGGFGADSAVQNPEALLRRAVMACLLWEDTAYETGKSGAENISALIPLVAPHTVALIAIEARIKQKLRHVPLYIATQMAKLDSHKPYVRGVLKEIIQRPDELTEFLAIYWKGGKTPIAKQVKLGLADAFRKFSEYQLAKYNRGEDIKLRDVLFMVHAKPDNEQQAEVWKKLVDGTLETPDTWEVKISETGKLGTTEEKIQAKKEEWTRLINENKLGALAFMRNLRNMNEVGVPDDIIRSGFASINSKWLLPVNYMAAIQEAPRFTPEIEALMLAGYGQLPKLPGHTVFVVDRSGSMGSSISSKSKMSRQDVANSMAIMARETCESVSIYATAGSDYSGNHSTVLIPAYRGFGLINAIRQANIGGGGIFTRQCLEYIRNQEKGEVDRIIVFSDSQDCDRGNPIPAPFGKFNYIVDVSSHSRGINYKGIWTVEISGWSEHFLSFIAALEGITWIED